MFVRQAPREMADLRAAVEAGNFFKIKTVAHNLRSTAAYVGMNPLGLAEIEQLERSAEEKQPLDFLKNQLERVEKLVGLAVAAAGDPKI